MTKDEALSLSRQYVCPDKVATFEMLGAVPVIGRREGYRMWDLDGHELLDMHLNGGTFNLGHRNPDLVATLTDALRTYDIGNHHFPSAARAALARTLVASCPGAPRFVVFASGGGEAVDIAIKSARFATGRRKIVSIGHGYHGHTGLALLAGEEKYASLFHSEDIAGEFVHVPFDDLDAMEGALAAGDVAAVLLETIPATFGFPMPSDGYLAGVAALAAAHGALYVADEVQTGLGRTGTLWGVEGYGVAPDILVTGKGLSGGLYPIAAAVMSERAGAWLARDGWAHVSTFGGAELGCIVASKVLAMTDDDAVRARVRVLADRFARGLADIAKRRPFLVEVRQRGLVMGLRFGNEMAGMMMTQKLYQRGVWAIFAAHDRSVLQFKPGLLLDDALADEVLGRLDDALAECP